jgi:hypothetical protein
MVSHAMLRQVSERLGQITEVADQPFGGINVLAMGDMFQLCPVQGKFVFESEQKTPFQLWRQLFVVLELAPNMRARDDPSFAALLLRLRHGKATESDLDLLATRVATGAPNTAGSGLHLFAERKEAHACNMEIAGKSGIALVECDAVDMVQGKGATHRDTAHTFAWDEDKECGGLATTMHLGPGVRVMLRRNIDTEDGLTNGAMGCVQRVHQRDGGVSGVDIKFDDERVGQRVRARLLNPVRTVHITPVTSAFEGRNGAHVQRTQLPICPAWAVTVHKAQGKTVDEAFVHLGDTMRHPGQAYVAISRVRRLRDLHFTAFVRDAICSNSLVVQEMDRIKARTLQVTAVTRFRVHSLSTPNSLN